MSGAIESLHRQYPSRFLTAIDTPVSAIYEHNPFITPQTAEDSYIKMEYPLIHQSDARPIHFLHAYTDFLGKRLGISLDCVVNRPYIYLSNEEKSWIGRIEEIAGRKIPYWLVNAGYKTDYTAKNWGIKRYQEVVDRLRGKIQFVQVGELAERHVHDPLFGVIDQRGKTNVRELIRMVYHADGVLCGTTFLMHLAAAFEKPAVVIAGGREPKWWNAYAKQTLISTIGMLSCCRDHACWKSRTVPLNDGDSKDTNLCSQPSQGPNPVPRCMEMIKPHQVAEIIENYRQ